MPTAQKALSAAEGSTKPVLVNFKTQSSSQVIRSAGLVVSAAMLGRLTGFGREWMVAHLLGSNALTDAYYAAFTLPNLLSYLVAGGALGMILIPIFTQYMATGNEEESWHIFSTVVTVASRLLLSLVVARGVVTQPCSHCVPLAFPRPPLV